MQELHTKCDKLTITINKIYNAVCPVLETAQDSGRGLPRLPVSSFEELRVWERFLKDHDNSLHVVSVTFQLFPLNSFVASSWIDQTNLFFFSVLSGTPTS